MRVASITVYPVKSMRGTDVDHAEVEFAGLRHDRRWMVVDANGENVTARTRHLMLAIAAVAAPDGTLTLTAEGMPPLQVPTPAGEPDVTVTLSRLPLSRYIVCVRPQRDIATSTGSRVRPAEVSEYSTLGGTSA